MRKMTRGCGLPLIVFEAKHKRGDLVEPALIQRIFFAGREGRGSPREDGCHSTGGRLPCRAAGQGVIEMPAQGDNATPPVCLLYILAHPVEWHTVDIDGMIEFDASQFPAIERRVVAGHVFYIAAARDILPTNSIGEVVLMAEEETAGRECFQVA